MCKQLFVCDQNGRALVGASCPDIGELGLANIYDDRDEVAMSFDPLRNFVSIEEIGQDWSEDAFLDSMFPEVEDDCDDTDADADVDADFDVDDDHEARASWWYDGVVEADAETDTDVDEEEDEVELTADQLDVMAMAELLRRRMSGPDYSRAGIQPAEKQYRGRQWARHKLGADPRPACKRWNCFALLAAEVAA